MAKKLPKSVRTIDFMLEEVLRDRDPKTAGYGVSNEIRALLCFASDKYLREEFPHAKEFKAWHQRQVDLTCADKRLHPDDDYDTVLRSIDEEFFSLEQVKWYMPTSRMAAKTGHGV